MASSGYYYRQYNECGKKIQVLDKNISELSKIRNSLTGDFYDEQSNVNKELDDLEEDLQKSVRHDSKFAVIASSCNSYKEKASTADKDLGSAVTSLESEIASLESKKRNLEAERDENWRRYRQEKEREDREERERRERAYQEFLKSLKNLF